jgi:hypothetical protein
MEVSINHKLYAYNELQKEITDLIGINECITICGVPYIGKSRVLKQLIYKNEWQERSTFINFEALSTPQNSSNFLKVLKSELEELYVSGKRIFIFQYTNLDSQSTKQVFEILNRFRQSCIETPSFIFLFSTHPEFYSEEFINCRIVFSNILYYKINTKEHNKFLRKQNETRFDKVISDSQYKEILEKSGGISALFKGLFQQAIYNQDRTYSLESLVRSFLNETPDKQLDIYRSHKRSAFEILHLKNEGIIGEDGLISSTLLRSALDDYSRDYSIYGFQEDIYINGNVKTSEFTEVERTVILKLLSGELMTRDEIAKNAVGEEEYTDYSEAAIDKFVSRLRLKLSQLGVSKNYIKTIKGKGFKIDVS